MKIIDFVQKSKVLVLTLLAIGISNPFFATTYTTVKDGNHNSSSVWSPSKPSFNSSNNNDTIIIQHDIKLKSNLNNVYAHVIIASGASLDGNKNFKLVDNGSLENNGTLEIKTLTLSWGSTVFDNNGNAEFSNDLVVNEGTVTNDGTIDVDDDLNNKWDGVFINNGSLTIGDQLRNDNVFTNTNSVLAKNLKNYSSFNNTGTLKLSGSLTNDWGSAFSSTGDIEVAKDVTNKGSFTQSGDTEIGDDFKSDWGSTSVFTGDVDVNDKFTAYGSISSTSTMDIGGNLDIDWGVPFTNSGNLNVSGNVASEGVFTNDGSVVIDGNLSIYNQLTNNNNISVGGDASTDWGSDVSNNGVIHVIEDFTNNGDFENEGSFWVDGTMDSAGGSVTGSGDLCNSDGVTDPTGGSKGSIDCNICGGDGGSLPVEMISYRASLVEKGVALEWVTASETNNDHFVLEVSRNGKAFENLSTVNGAGNSDKHIFYNFVDSDVESGLNVYRLTQVDFDGSRVQVGLVEVHVDADDKLQVNVFPNPVAQGNNLQIDISHEARIEVYNSQGQMVEQGIHKEGNTVLTTESFKKGFYIIKIFGNNSTVTKKVHIL